MTKEDEPIKYEYLTMELFGQCIELGYEPYFTMPQYVTRGCEIEALLIIDWFKKKGIVSEETDELEAIKEGIEKLKD